MKLSDKAKSRVHLVYGIVLAAMLVLVGILFISACYSIYESGASPFTRESIGEAFSRIAVPTYLTVSLVFIGALINVIWPVESPRLKGLRTPRVLVDSLAAKVDVAALDSESKTAIEKERKLREVLSGVRAALIAVSSILPLFVLLNPARFPAESGRYNAEILHGMLLYLAFLAPVAIFEVVHVIVCDRSFTREHEALKAAIKTSGITHAAEQEHNCVFCRANEYIAKNSKAVLLGVRIALVGCAVVFIVLGVTNGGMADVLNKAIKICTECIGLG